MKYIRLSIRNSPWVNQQHKLFDIVYFVTEVTDVARPFDFVTDTNNLFRSILKKNDYNNNHTGEELVIENWNTNIRESTMLMNCKV